MTTPLLPLNVIVLPFPNGIPRATSAVDCPVAEFKLIIATCPTATVAVAKILVSFVVVCVIDVNVCSLPTSCGHLVVSYLYHYDAHIVELNENGLNFGLHVGRVHLILIVP